MVLKTRPPTGKVPWPVVLLEGPELVGKTWLCAEFSGCPRVGQMYWINIGEIDRDDYAHIPGASFEFVIHDGSFPGIVAAIEDVRAEAQKVLDAGRPPVVLTIDTMGGEWDLLKDWATNRCRSSRKNRELLARDPNAEISVASVYWTDANARHYQLMRILRTFPGIVLLIARGKWVAVMDEQGNPIAGKKDYRVEAQKNLGFDVSCWVRLRHDSPAQVVGLRSVTHGVRPGYEDPKPLPDGWNIEWLIFDAIGCDPANAQVAEYVEPKSERTPDQIRDEALRPQTGPDRIRELYREAKHDLAVMVENEAREDEALGILLVRVGRARMKADEKAHARMHALWNQTEFARDRDGRLRFTSEIVGREVTSSAELTTEDAMKVVERLTAFIKNSSPPPDTAPQRELEGASA